MIVQPNNLQRKLERKLELFLVLFFVLIIVAVLIYVQYPYTVSQLTGYTGCSVYETFDIKCPTCRGTRAVSALMDGRLFDALQYNALVIVTIPIVLYYGIRTSVFILKGNSMEELRINTKFIWFWLVVIILFTVIRNLV